jgi:uncharacterized protein YhhL (DUF1145 family)
MGFVDFLVLMFGMPLLELQQALPQVLSSGLGEAVGVLFFGMSL